MFYGSKSQCKSGNRELTTKKTGFQEVYDRKWSNLEFPLVFKLRVMRNTT